MARHGVKLNLAWHQCNGVCIGGNLASAGVAAVALAASMSAYQLASLAMASAKLPRALNGGIVAAGYVGGCVLLERGSSVNGNINSLAASRPQQWQHQ